MPGRKTSPFSLAFATAALAVGLCGIYAMNGSGFMTDRDGATATLKNAGYTPVSVGGYDALACQKGEIFSTSFVAKNQQGKTFSGAVCKTIFGRQRISFE